MNWIMLVCLILLACAICGQLATVIGQSRVIGEITAGILLGPTVLGAWFPQASTQLFAPESMHVVRSLSELGLIILMVEVPWHAAGIGSKGGGQRVPALIATLGIVLSFSLGCIVGAWSKASLAPMQPYWPYVIFCGVALSVTALPVLVRIIQEHAGIDGRAGQLALSAAVYTDVFAWFALALVLTLQLSGTTGVVDSLLRVAGLSVYAALTFLLLRPWLRKWASYAVLGERSKVALALLYCLFSAQVTAILGFHEAVGAVMAAYVFHDLLSMEQAWRRWVGRFGHLFLTPIFFASSGIQVSLGAFSDPTLWLWLLLFLVGGTVGKVLGSYVGARMSGLTPNVSLELGVLMNTKGLVELVVLGVGLQAGVLSESSYGVLLMLALVSMALTNPLISLLNRRVRKSDTGYSTSPHTGV
ncbi:cation:proton antiporter [Pseudomonas sp. B21-023]|uniref:cation:proton antiporter n=1 Tax=unclassified Pseudomonas TaxID=196821 RepID=UPI00215F6C14|nr:MULTISPECIES: cation:proton antiporter [unclassified Pseudomonas]UVL18871.1 cation:proton antiporter [Pseudomonas sp. B21-044]UVM16283.1 cation:proton antiporter [Pseudomonas sp. B21-023]